ncbi:DUF4172 domain-containing protein [Aeromonas caviae]|uniref:DUF4172 domain-containing protein n=1 Tax=Aeromonas caviae TaxID=648 RepID=UPI0022868A01|nr:DUF4172 domain-containing protein [Aeromonas caviae]
MEPFWIWQQADWPNFHWRDSEILPRLRQVQRRLGILTVIPHLILLFSVLDGDRPF